MNHLKPTLTLSDSIRNLILKLGGRKSEATTTVDLEYCSKVLESIEDNVKIVCAVMNSAVFENGKSLNLRKSLLEKGLIEAVIKLPCGLIEGTAISITIMLFSKGNDSVMVIDASKQFQVENRHKHILTDANIDTIIKACSTETKISSRIALSDIAENDYDLSPEWYINHLLLKDEGMIEFEKIIKGYVCGLQLNPDELEKLQSDYHTDYQYAQPKHIINGGLDVNLPYLSEFKESYKNHQIKNHNIIISKLGRPLKVAVAEVPENTTVIAVGRLYVFEIDEEKADPYFIKKFLSSTQGQEILQSCSKSMAINNLQINRLLKIPVKIKGKYNGK